MLSDLSEPAYRGPPLIEGKIACGIVLSEDTFDSVWDGELLLIKPEVTRMRFKEERRQSQEGFACPEEIKDGLRREKIQYLEKDFGRCGRKTISAKPWAPTLKLIACMKFIDIGAILRIC